MDATYTKTKLFQAIALMLAVAPAAQAGSKDDSDTTGGYRVGPLGQSFDGANPAAHSSMRTNAGQSFDFSPSAPPKAKIR